MLCKKIGISRKKILIDPGFGFGKNVSHNYHLLANLSKISSLNLPIIVGLSRKSMIGNILNNKISCRLIGSVTCAIIAAIQGAKILRVHDVQETFEAIQIINAVNLYKNLKND